MQLGLSVMWFTVIVQYCSYSASSSLWISAPAALHTSPEAAVYARMEYGWRAMCSGQETEECSLHRLEITGSNPDDAMAMRCRETGMWNSLSSLGRRGILCLTSPRHHSDASQSKVSVSSWGRKVRLLGSDAEICAVYLFKRHKGRRIGFDLCAL